MLLDLPNELANIICSYIESPTHKIIRDLYFDPFYNCINPYECLKLNKKYNFKHIHIPRLLKAIDTLCPHCYCRLYPEEYVYTGIYERFYRKKLCKECLDKEKFRICFEICELFVVLVIFTFIWLSIIHILIVIEFSH
jgi:hypothetical protein